MDAATEAEMHTSAQDELKDLRAENEALLAENARLRRELASWEADAGWEALSRVQIAWAYLPDAVRVEATAPDGETREYPFYRVRPKAAWAEILLSVGTPPHLEVELRLPAHIIWAAQRIARTDFGPCDSCAIGCFPTGAVVGADAYFLCPECHDGDPRRLPGYAFLFRMWRLLRARLGRPPTLHELREETPSKNAYTRKNWMGKAEPSLLEWARLERVAGRPLLVPVPPLTEEERIASA